MSVGNDPITDLEVEQLAIEFYDRFYRGWKGIGPLYSCRKKAVELLEHFSLDKIREFITILTDC